MEEILNDVVAYLAVIGPSVASILSIVAAVITTIKNIKKTTADATVQLGIQGKRLVEVTSNQKDISKRMEETSDVCQKLASELVSVKASLATTTKSFEDTKEELEKTKKELHQVKQQLKARE